MFLTELFVKIKEIINSMVKYWMRIKYVPVFRQIQSIHCHSTDNMKKTLVDLWFVSTKTIRFQFSRVLLLQIRYQLNKVIQERFRSCIRVRYKWQKLQICCESDKEFTRIFTKIKNGSEILQVNKENWLLIFQLFPANPGNKIQTYIEIRLLIFRCRR